MASADIKHNQDVRPSDHTEPEAFLQLRSQDLSAQDFRLPVRSLSNQIDPPSSANPIAIAELRDFLRSANNNLQKLALSSQHLEVLQSQSIARVYDFGAKDLVDFDIAMRESTCEAILQNLSQLGFPYLVTWCGSSRNPSGLEVHGSQVSLQHGLLNASNGEILGTYNRLFSGAGDRKDQHALIIYEMFPTLPNLASLPTQSAPDLEPQVLPVVRESSPLQSQEPPVRLSHKALYTKFREVRDLIVEALVPERKPKPTARDMEISSIEENIITPTPLGRNFAKHVNLPRLKELMSTIKPYVRGEFPLELLVGEQFAQSYPLAHWKVSFDRFEGKEATLHIHRTDCRREGAQSIMYGKLDPETGAFQLERNIPVGQFTVFVEQLRGIPLIDLLWKREGVSTPTTKIREAVQLELQEENDWIKKSQAVKPEQTRIRRYLAVDPPDSQVISIYQREIAVSQGGNPYAPRYLEAVGAGPCVILSLYDPHSKVGCLVHIDSSLESEMRDKVLRMKDTRLDQMLIEAFEPYRRNGAPLELRIAGGRKDGSEETIVAIRELANRLGNVVFVESDILVNNSTAVILDLDTGELYNTSATRLRNELYLDKTHREHFAAAMRMGADGMVSFYWTSNGFSPQRFESYKNHIGDRSLYELAVSAVGGAHDIERCYLLIGEIYRQIEAIEIAKLNPDPKIAPLLHKILLGKYAELDSQELQQLQAHENIGLKLLKEATERDNTQGADLALELERQGYIENAFQVYKLIPPTFRDQPTLENFKAKLKSEGGDPYELSEINNWSPFMGYKNFMPNPVHVDNLDALMSPHSVSADYKLDFAGQDAAHQDVFVPVVDYGKKLINDRSFLFAYSPVGLGIRAIMNKHNGALEGYLRERIQAAPDSKYERLLLAYELIAQGRMAETLEVLKER